MDRPKQKSINYYEWHEIERFFKEESGIDFDNYGGACLWEYFIEQYDLSNGSFICITCIDVDEQHDKHMKALLQFLVDEFGEGEEKKLWIRTSW